MVQLVQRRPVILLRFKLAQSTFLWNIKVMSTAWYFTLDFTHYQNSLLYKCIKNVISAPLAQHNCKDNDCFQTGFSDTPPSLVIGQPEL